MTASGGLRSAYHDAMSVRRELRGATAPGLSGSQEFRYRQLSQDIDEGRDPARTSPANRRAFLEQARYDLAWASDGLVRNATLPGQFSSNERERYIQETTNRQYLDWYRRTSKRYAAAQRYWG